MKRMIYDLVPAAIVGLIIFGLLTGTKVVKGSAGLSLAIVICTNTVYETFLMFLMAYGIIHLPREFWVASQYDRKLAIVQNKAAADFRDLSEDGLNLGLVVADILKTNEHVSDHTFYLFY